MNSCVVYNSLKREFTGERRLDVDDRQVLKGPYNYNGSSYLQLLLGRIFSLKSRKKTALASHIKRALI
jgi:hypothetical protein